MKISTELTLTPLKDNYVPTIKTFILQVRQLGFVTKENPLSTQIYGDFDNIMNKLLPLIRTTFLEEEAVMLHIKMVKGDRSNYEPDF